MQSARPMTLTDHLTRVALTAIVGASANYLTGILISKIHMRTSSTNIKFGFEGPLDRAMSQQKHGM